MTEFEQTKLAVLIDQGESIKKTNLCGKNIKYIEGNDFDKWLQDCIYFLKQYFPNENITKNLLAYHSITSLYATTFSNFIEQLRELKERV